MGRMTSGHLARLDVRENPNISEGLVPPYLVWAKVFNYPIR
jgi:hypothetical protein